jgi:L-amino acid N-acyltransferase YncA
MNVTIDNLVADDWPQVQAIYREGIEDGQATFETEIPAWEAWDAGHLSACRLVARDRPGDRLGLQDRVGLEGREVMGWAALSPVSRRPCYAGVAEVSIYVARASRGCGVGKALLEALIAASERHGIWTLQGMTFAENEPSLRLQARCGFRRVGYRERIAQLHGVWKDTVLMERRSAAVWPVGR